MSKVVSQDKQSESVDSSDEKPDGSIKGGSAGGATEKKAGASLSSDPVSFNKYIDIFPHKPMPIYNIAGNKAYDAISREHGDAALIAIVCERHNIPRRHATAKYKMLNNPSLATLVAQGTIYWPPAGEERYVFFYANNWGHPLLVQGQEAALGWRPEEVMDLVVKPMINAFQDFKDRDFVHGAIRPENMFGGVDGNGDGRPKKVILGDCFSAPPSFIQNALYEPIERAMADPVARGLGTRADDLYSLGVSLTVMLRVSDPMKGFLSDDIIKRKVDVGTYAALTGKDRFKGEILELLRGLLHDDPSQRWTLVEILTWMDGRRLSPKQALVRKKAPRPFVFMEGKYHLMPRLAMVLEKSSSETRRVVEDESLMTWLTRSVDDENTIERLEKALDFAKDGGMGANYPDKLVSYVSAALDTFAPLRYRGLRLMGDGLGGALAEAYVQGKDLSPYADILSSNIMITWLSFHENKNIDISGLFTKFEQCRRYVKSPKVADGLERCLYLLNKECFCLSDALKPYYVTTPDKLLRAFENLTQQGKAPTFFIDRHVAAFLAERDSKVIEQCIYDLNSGEKPRIIMANLRCLAEIQNRYDVGKTPGVAKAFYNMVDRICERYHDKLVREKIDKELGEAVNSGNLRKILAILDDQTVITNDKVGYKKAQLEYQDLKKEAEELEAGLQDKDNYGVETGREWAAIISGLLAFGVITIVALTIISGNGGGIF